MIPLSFNKRKTIIEIARHVQKGELENRQDFLMMNDSQIREKLTKIKGIGEWTAQMLMIFNLGKLDVFPAGDFALRKNYSLFPLPLFNQGFQPSQYQTELVIYWQQQMIH